MYYFPNRLMNDSRQQQTKPMEFIDYVAQPPRSQWNAPELTEEELFADCIEVDGLFYLMDENHSGFLFLTDECAKKYKIECGENGDAEPIDWDIWDEEGETWKEDGYKWNFHIMQCAGVYDSSGKQVKEGWNDDDVYIMNGIVEEMLNDEGCEVMGWCDG